MLCVRDENSAMSLRKFYVEAWQALDHLLEDDAMGFETEADGLDDIWLKLSETHTPSPKIWKDAYLATFAICSSMRLVTLNKDLKI
ncbi:MAG: hypothetical protein ACK5AA_03870 [Akkermansiaceae bacterium]